MNNVKLVSIGMPVYNDRIFLEKSIESILAQTYNNFELILSDDNSTDGSDQICRKYVAKDKRIKYIKQDKNLGISHNMEFLLHQAKGVFFMWAGNDDLWHPDFILLHVKALENSTKAVSAFCPYLFIDENDEVLQYPPPRNRSYGSHFSLIRLLKLAYFWDDGFGYGMFRREKIQNVKFPVWWWINKKRAYNNIYPTLFYYLSVGEYIHVNVNETPLWYNRLKSIKNINHKVPYSTSFFKGFLAFCLWKFNVYVKCVEDILKSKKIVAFFNILIITPFFSIKFIWDILDRLKGNLLALLRRKNVF